MIGLHPFERWKSARGGAPLVVLELFRERSFSSAWGRLPVRHGRNPAMFFTLALYLQIGLHFSPLAAGLTFAPAPVGFFIAATLSGRLIRRIGRRLVLIALLMKAAAWTAIAVIVHRNGVSLRASGCSPSCSSRARGRGGRTRR